MILDQTSLQAGSGPGCDNQLLITTNPPLLSLSLINYKYFSYFNNYNYTLTQSLSPESCVMSAATHDCTKGGHKMMILVLTVCLAGDIMLECSRNVILECISILNLKGKLGKKLFPCID